jgi:phosphoenolpyruvate-protein phosphotransferase (PTS system enzyme I)
MSIQGIAASPGFAIGKAFIYQETSVKVERRSISEDQVSGEFERLTKAVQEAKAEITALRDKTEKEMGADKAEIFTAHLMVLEDPELLQGIQDAVKQEHCNVEAAVQDVVQNYVQMFEAMDNEYMRERAADIRDVGARIIRKLLHVHDQSLADIDEDVVVLAHDLTPSDTAQLNHHVLGFVTEIGGRTSHSAIMARSLEIPAVVGTKELLNQNIENGTMLILDGSRGELIINPSEQQLKEYQERVDAYKKQHEELRKMVNLKSETTDQHQVELVANIGTPKDAEAALQYGTEGVGLYRTEFLYMDRDTMPSEQEQFEAYRSVLLTMGERPVVIRTLDIGGDKELPYLNLPKEANPFLGYRAIRLCLDRTDLFKIQLRAILRATRYGNLKIMFPMISSLEELRQAKAVLEEAKQELIEQGEEIGTYEVGMMIEIPSSAVIADLLADEVDFFSIGTNDLIQYTMAVDRMNEKISHLYQPFHPALIRLVKTVIDAAHSKGKWVGMCGEMAGDELAVPLLLGLGLDEFSMGASSILRARAMIRKLSLQQAKEWAQHVLTLKTPDEIKGYLESKIQELA